MSIRDRLQRIEKQTGIDKGRTVTVWTDDYGHTDYPMGKPRPGDKVLEIHIGGIDLVKDL